MSHDVLTEVVEGWTGPLPFTLKADDVAVDLTGLTVHLYVRDAGGNVLENFTSSGLRIQNSTTGQVDWSPSSSQLTAAGSPFRLRFRIKDSTGGAIFFPNDEEDLILVHPV